MRDPLYIDEEVAEEMGAESAHLDDAVNPFAWQTTLAWAWLTGRARAIAFGETIARRNDIHQPRTLPRVWLH